MASAISGKLVRGKIVYNAAQVRQILMSELSDGDDSHDNVEASDGEQSSDDGEVDVLENLSDAASDSECEDSAEVEVDQGPTYRSKNNQETWYENPQRNTEGRRAARNIMHITPRPTRYDVRNVDTAESAFQLFLTPSLLQQIIDWTSKKGRLVYRHQWTDVDNIEMHCYLGLLTLAGVMKSHNESVMSLWNEESGRAIFNRLMARNRFTVIFRCIQFEGCTSSNKEHRQTGFYSRCF